MSTEESVRAATARFYVALNAMFTGDVEPMTEVWSHADAVTYRGPTGGVRRGWEEVRADWQRQADLQLGGRIEPSELDVFASDGSDIALTHNTETGTNPNTPEGSKDVSIRATHVFRKEGGRWLMISDHTDLLPFLDET